MDIEELEDIPEKWDGMKAALRDRVEPKGHEGKHRTELLARQRKDRETLAQYVSELRRIGKLAYPRQDRQGREDFLKDLFMRGQGSDAFREHTLTQEMGSLAEAVCHEAGMQDISLRRHVSKPKVRFSDPAPSAETSAPVIRAQRERERESQRPIPSVR